MKQPTKKHKPITPEEEKLADELLFRRQTSPAATEQKPRFHNYPYRAELSRTEVGSPIIEIVPRNPRAPSGRSRQMNIFIYDLASEMERRSEELCAEWLITVEAWGARVMVELGKGSDTEKKRADEFVATLLGDWHLA